MSTDINQFLPHGFCLSWQPGLLWLHIISNSVIALAYFSIPFALAVFVKRRRDLEFKPVFVMFALFIMACGLTHVMEVWVLWNPDYWLDGGVKAFTAAVSIATAVMLWPLLPKVLALPAPSELVRANTALRQEMSQRVQAEEGLRTANSELERRVAERTEELVELNRKLIREIEERRLAEDHVRELNAQLESRVERRTAELRESVKDLESFSYTVAHDLRAPLRAIDGYANILLEEHRPGLPRPAQELLDRTSSGVRRLGQLIDDLLAFARTGRQPLAVKQVDMAELAASVVEELRGDYPGTTVEIGDLPGVAADPALMRQVMRNLVSNAFKFSADDGAPRIEIDAVRSEGRTTYFVRDNGIGFDMAHADKLFGVFVRLHNVEHFPGTGVGLAIVHRIVQRHGGRVWVQASPGEGARFNIELPDRR